VWEERGVDSEQYGSVYLIAINWSVLLPGQKALSWEWGCVPDYNSGNTHTYK